MYDVIGDIHGHADALVAVLLKLGYEPHEGVYARIGPSDIHGVGVLAIRAIPAGTLLFCNTAGFHRGGFSTTAPRVLATATYSSPASLASLTLRSYTYTGVLGELDAPTRFALS